MRGGKRTGRGGRRGHELNVAGGSSLGDALDVAQSRIRKAYRDLDGVHGGGNLSLSGKVLQQSIVSSQTPQGGNGGRSEGPSIRGCAGCNQLGSQGGRLPASSAARRRAGAESRKLRRQCR